MGDEPQNETMPPGGGHWLSWTLFFVLIVYPLSVGPAAKIFGPSPPAPVRVFYAPLGYLHDHSQLVHSFYAWYANLWGVHL